MTPWYKPVYMASYPHWFPFLFFLHFPKFTFFLFRYSFPLLLSLFFFIRSLSHYYLSSSYSLNFCLSLLSPILVNLSLLFIFSFSLLFFLPFLLYLFSSFGVPTDKFVTYFILLAICKWKNLLPNAIAFKSLVIKHKESEYNFAKKENKRPVQFGKCRFNFQLRRIFEYHFVMFSCVYVFWTTLLTVSVEG